jgi:pimeloyl-ACP methyl ester carboxylesterase
MEVPTRPFGPARIVALVLIAIAAAGLAYLHFAPDAGSVSVPAGAHAGELILKPCSYATENGSYAADCGTLVVPENRHDPRTRLIALPVIRIRAGSAHPADPIFRLEGGPGLSNMHFADASRFARNRDVVLVGYRGVDGSSVLDCPEVVSAMKHSADFLATKSFDAYARGYRSCAGRLQADGVDLAGYTLPERVDDLEAARRAFGYHAVDLLSESAGTRTALIYSWRYPKSIRRSVMIGVNPPGNFLWHPKTTEEQIRKYAALCSADDSCRKRTPDLAATLKDNAAHMPDHWWFLPIKTGNAQVGTFFGLMNSTSAASPISAPMTLDTWFAAANGDPSGLWLLSVMAQLVFPDAQVKGDVAAVALTDASFATSYYASARGRGSILGNPATDFLWAGGRLTNAWPASPDENEYDRVQTSNVETLLIGGSLDVATPPQNATRELLPHLPNGHQVVLSGLGHTDDFWDYEPAASGRLINTFLDSGKIDQSLYTHTAIDFEPFTQRAIAKIVLGTMLGFTALTVLSLLWLPRRVRKRGRFGRKASASIRSLYVPVLGLGGWFAGTLVVLTALPTVPLDSDLLAGLSVGIPTSLGIYWAWVHRDWTARTKTIGLAAALCGALVGAWLGFMAIAGLFAIFSAIVGAAVGSNLVVVLLDIARDRSARELAAAKAAQRAAFTPAGA